MTILRITNGTTTLDLMDGVNYQATADSWAPNVAKLRRGQLGRGIYEPVVEQFEVMVYGALEQQTVDLPWKGTRDALHRLIRYLPRHMSSICSR